MSETTRKHLRLPLESRVFIELVAANAGDSGGAEIAVCKTLDVSLNGMRVALEYEVTVDAILHIGVDVPRENSDAIDTFYLAAQVRWCRPNDEPDYPWSAGFTLLNASNSDIGQWVALLSELDE